MLRGSEAPPVRSRTASSPAPLGAQAPAPSPSPDPLNQLIERENLDDTIYARLRLMIAERRILPGERINVDRIARNLGVSRTPVVNALKRLGQEHVVEWVLRRGAFVRQFTTRELARLFEVREMLEGLAARRAAERISRDEVDRLAAQFRALDLSDHGPALERYIAEDRAFHLRLLTLADNAHLTHATESVNLMVFTYQMGLARPPAETVKEHWTILTALRKHDPDASEAAMRLHLRRSREQLDRLADAEERQAETERVAAKAGVRSPRMRPHAPSRAATTKVSAGLRPQ
jgi:DNA-binding GntR family transcriptional regulator